MSAKRTIQALSIGNSKRRKSANLTYFQRTMQECGLTLKVTPEKCEATEDKVYIIRNLKTNLKQDINYPDNIETFLSEFQSVCNDKETFKHYLFLNIVRKINDKTYKVDDSVIKILLNIPILQTNLIKYVFDKVMDLLDENDFGLWVKMTLKAFSNLDTVERSEELSTKLIDLLDISSDKFVKLEIISAIPNIIGDREHDNIASEMSRILSNDSYLIPSILDCLTYLCLSDQQFERLQKETLNLMQPSNAAYFSNFVKFLTSKNKTNTAYEEIIQGLRKELGWSSIVVSEADIATSQILTAKEIRNSMQSEAGDKAWLKVIGSCTSHTDHKPIDIVLLLIMASLSDMKQTQVENMMSRQIKLQLLKEELLDKAFQMFKPILKENIMVLINLANSLLKSEANPLVKAFGAHMHMVMFSELTECREIIVIKLVQSVVSCNKSALNTLEVLNKIASENLSKMKLQSNQILKLLDKLDDMDLVKKKALKDLPTKKGVMDLPTTKAVMELPTTKAVMDLVCRLAYSVEDSVIRDEFHIIMRKQLGSSTLAIKIQGILAGIHAVKYLMRNNTINVQIPEDANLNMTSCFPDGDLLEAAQIIELIFHSTTQFPDIMANFYDEMYKIIHQANYINKSFLVWLTYALTSYWQENFLVDKIETEVYGDIRISMQLGLNLESEVDEAWAVNIAGLTLEDNREIYIEVLPSLLKIIRILHYRKDNGDLSEIDALLGCPIVMPILHIDSINDLSVSSVKKILKCYLMCVNWMRELLNAFVVQKDDVLKPKILKRIQRLRNLEETIDKIRDKGNKSEHDDLTPGGTTKSQQTQMTQNTKSKVYANNTIQYRPLDLTLLNVIQYDMTPQDGSETEITFEDLTYLLSYINVSLEKVLVPQIKKKTFLNKDSIEVYSYSEAEKQSEVVKTVLPNLMTHIDLIISFLDCHIIEEGSIDIEALDILHVIKGLLCLERIYELLTIYFKWIEFKINNVPLLLKSSLQIVAKVEDDTVQLEDLLILVAKAFQKHEKYMITISTAASLVQFMKAIQELSTRLEVPKILKDMTDKFLSKQWKTMNHQLEKGTFYNRCLDSLIKVYLGNNQMSELKTIATTLVDEVRDLRDQTSTLSSLKSINKGNFYILFKILGLQLYDKIKSHIKGGFTNKKLLEMWKTVAIILKLMSEMVTTLTNKNTSSIYLKQSIRMFNLLLSKGFHILKSEFEDYTQIILDLLKDFQTSTDCLQDIRSHAGNKSLIPEISNMEGLLTDFIYKTKDLLKANDRSDALKMFNVKNIPNSTSKSKKVTQQFVHDETVEDLDDDLPEDVTDDVVDVAESMNLDFVGLSDMI